MSLESFWYGDRLVAQPHMAAANSSSLVENALLEDIRQRLEQELPMTSYMEQDTLAQLIRVSAKTLANRRALNPERFPAPVYFGGNKKPLFPRADIVNWLANEEYQAKVVYRHKFG